MPAYVPRLAPDRDVFRHLPAYGQAAQPMAISRDGARESRLSVCLDAADEYGIGREARDIVEDQVAIIDRDWDEVAGAVGLSARSPT